MKLQFARKFVRRTAGAVLFVFVLFGASVAMFGNPFPVFAAAKTWDGGGGADTNWNTCANWNGDTCPVSGADTVTFDSTAVTNVTINTDINVTTFTIAATYSGIISQGSSNIVATSFSQAAGTFTGGAGSFDLNGAYTLSGGTFTAPSGAMTVSGAWTHTAGGTFTHNNGSVTSDGSGNVTWDVTTTETFYNYTVNRTGSATVTISSGDTLLATNNLALTDGKISTGTARLTGATGSVASTWDGGVTSAAVLIDGAGVQTFTVNGGSLQPGVTFTVNNASASVVAAGTGALTFGGTTLTAGAIDFSGYDASWSAAVSIAGGTFTSGSGTKTFAGTFSTAGGTFNGNTSTLDFNGTFTISSGTFNATSGAMTAASSWTHTVGGTFTHNNGSVAADGNASATWNVTTTETFYDLTINKTAGTTLTVSLGDTLVATNSLTLTDGTVSTGGLRLTGATGSVASTWDGGASTSTLTIDGAGTQTFTLNGGAGEPAVTFTVNNASATVGVAGTGTITLNVTVLTAGAIDTSGFTFANTGTYSQSGGTFTSGTGTKTITGAFSQSGGTFNGNTATLDLNASFTLSAGTFNATTGTMTVATGWTHTAGGTFTHNGGNVTADTSVGGTWDVATTETFGSLTINKTLNVAVTIATGDTLIATSTLTVTDGKITAGTVQANGNVSFAPELDSSTASLVFGGSGTQTFDGGGTSTWDGSVVISGTSTVQMTGGFTLNAASKNLALASGTLDLNGQALTVNGTSATFIVDSGATLQLQGGETITANTNYPQLDIGSTVKYTGTSGPYTLKDYTYHHLTIAGGASSVFVLAANESFAGNVTLTTGILSQGGFTMAVVGTFANNATLRRLQVETFTGTMDIDSGTVEYVGDGDGAAETVTVTDFGGIGTDYYNLTINDVNATKDIFALGAATTIAGTLQVTLSEFQQNTQTLTPANIIVDGGTLTGGSGAITVSGAVTISSGTFTSTSNTLTVSGAWTHTAGGTFTHNSGTVAFTGSAATIDVSSTESFSALTINKTGGQTLTIASGDALVAAGVLTLTDGAFATGSITAQGNIVVGAGWDVAGSGVINATGTGIVTLDASSNLDNPLTVNKAGGSFTLASAYTLDHANADLTLTLGTFSTGNYTVTTSSGSDIAVNGGTFGAGSSTMTIAGLLTIAGGTYNGSTSTGTVSGAFLLSSGAYNGDTSTPTFSGGLTISGGTLTASSGVTTVSGAFTHTAGGTFTHNSGTVAFTGNSATVDVATSETFSALTLNKTTGQTLTIASGDTLVMVGTLTLTDGIADGNNFEAQGSVAIGAGYDGGTASLKFSGGAAQSLNLTGVESIFNGDIEVAKSAETLTLGSALTMDAVGQDLTITSGTFSTSGTNYGLTIAGDLLMNGGTTALNASTVAVTGTARLNGGSVTSSGGSMTAGTLQVTSGTYAQGTQTVAPTALVVDGGTFTGGGGSMTAGSITLSSGTLTAPSGTLSVTGGWTHTAGGTFTHNSGTVAFTGNSATIDVSSTESFSALTINKTGGQTLTIASGDALVAAGVLTLTDGAFATGSVTAQGNIVVGAGWDAAGSGTVNATGTAVQTLDVSAGAGLLDNPLTVNKAGGSFTLASAYTLDAATADLTLILGTFSTGGFTLTTASGSDIAVNGGTMNTGTSTMTIAGGLTVAGGTYNGNDATPTFSGAALLSSGAYNGSTNGDTFSGGLTISGGTFTASDATTTVSGAWTHTGGGTFTHNSGTVSFTGTAASIDVATTETFSTLTINKNNTATLTIASGDSLVSTGTLTLTNGAVGTGTLTPQGAVSVGAGFDGGDAVLQFGGSSAQTFTLTGATDKYNGDITVAKTSGTVTLGSALVMDAAGQDLTVTTGGFATGDNALTVAGNVAANGGTLGFGASTVDMNGNLTVGGGTLTLGTAAVTLAGDATYTSGTMTPNTSTVTLDGTNQTLAGATVWYNLTKNVTTAATLTFPSSVTTTIGGTLALTGAVDQVLSIRSSTTGVQHTLSVGTAGTYVYLDVKDSNPLTTLTCLTSSSGCVNSGSNASTWKFTAASGGTATPSLSGGAGSAGTVGDDSVPTTVGDFAELRAPTITLLAPNGGETYAPGESINIIWSTDRVVDLVNVLVSYDDGDSWESLAENEPNFDVYTWAIPSGASASEAVIKVQGTDLSSITTEDENDATFAIQTVTVAEEDAETDTTETTETTETASDVADRIMAMPTAVSVHELVKLRDDGNAETTADSAVYYVGADGKRHAFPNQAIFSTWYCSFDDVEVISSRDMAAIALGTNVTYRPGVRMVKFISVPKVYAVDRFGELHWVKTEAIATALYGSTWNRKIDDLSDAFFGNYEFGDDITTADDFDPSAAEESVEYPSDSIVIPGFSSEPQSEGLVCS